MMMMMMKRAKIIITILMTMIRVVNDYESNGDEGDVYDEVQRKDGDDKDEEDKCDGDNSEVNGSEKDYTEKFSFFL